LQQFLLQCDQDEPLTWIGLGSNILVSDAGLPGTVILTQGVLNELSVVDGQMVRVEAGVSCAQAARFAARHGIGKGGEFLAGIPGTIGGALFMNAGAFGGETWDRVIAVDTINREGKITRRKKSAFTFGYRFCRGLAVDEWFVAGYFQFTAGDSQQSLQKIKDLLQRRADTQPTGEPTCGSVFRNPPGDHAARLIESVGLKGYQIGGAQISQKHANFIVNTGAATAEDVRALIAHIQHTVFEQCAVRLTPEVQLLGWDQDTIASTGEDEVEVEKDHD